MGLYDRFVLPRLIDLAMRSSEATRYRAATLAAAEGRVLEMGIGSGLNLPFYGSGVREIVGVDPSAELLRMAGPRAAAARFPVSFVNRGGENLPFAVASFDVAVTTWTLCTIKDAPAALAEMRRVLKPGGRLLFVEHGRAPDPGVARWQTRLNPLWRRCAGGCNLDRPIAELIAAAGFRIDRLETGYARAPKPMGFMYQGSARPR
jgi:ubiquinone/menaquinone biosynthesis C-methylase UbiE